MIEILDPALNPVLAFGLRLAVAVILLAAAVHKLRHWQDFKNAVAGYELLPGALVPSAAMGLVTTEIVIVAGLMLLPMEIVPAIGAASLLAFYGVAMTVALVQGKRQLDCGCGGLSKSRNVSASLVVRNVVIAAVALFAATPVSLSGFIWMDWGTALFIAAFGALLYAAADTLMSNSIEMSAGEMLR